MSFTITGTSFPDAIPELHTHVRSDKDAFIFPEKLAEKCREMGMPGIAITDHGVLSSIEDYRHVLQSAGLKVIPGVEMYVDDKLGRNHAILLSIDDEGYHGISKIVTESNKTLKNGYPVITEEKLLELAEKYKGHIIFTTACMQGVISSIFLRNEKADTLIEKAAAKRDKYFSRESGEYLEAEQTRDEAEEMVNTLRLERDEVKRTAEQKFAAREKKVSKLKGGEREEALKLLEDDKKKAEKAQMELPKILKQLKVMQGKLTTANKKFRELSLSADKYDEYQKKIDGLEAEKADEDTLIKDAEDTLDRYITAFGKENVYGEVQYHGIKEEAVCFPLVVKVCDKCGIKYIATNDVHMLTNSEEDLVRRCVLRSMRFQTEFIMPSSADKELYLKDTKERYEALKQILPDTVIVKAFQSTIEVFDRCSVEFKTSEHYPVASENPAKDLERLVEEGKKWRFPNGFPDEKVYNERLKKEIHTIESMGYDNYHLVVMEFLAYGTLLGKVPKERIPDAPLDTEELKQWIKDNKWEKNAGYRIGTGRGSDGGSLVCFLLGITNLDPIQHGLLFERFLNPERVSMPDIDSDISADTRQKVIDHCKLVYGEKAVCGIMTSTFLGSKGAVKTAAKYYGMYLGKDKAFLSLGNKISDMVPDVPDVTFKSEVDRNTGKLSEKSGSIPLMDYLKMQVQGNADALNILKWAGCLEGTFTSYGAHAAGIVITEKGSDVSDILPLRYNSKLGMMTTQCAKDDVEANGLLKFDFLGLQTLDIITEAVQMIQERTGKAIDVLKLDITDKNIYEHIFQTGDTGAVFQFESEGMRKLLIRFHPEKFSDLVLLNAAYRPGPMQFLDDIIAVKTGKKKASYLTPELKPILKDTYGAIVYQEQVMEICQVLAGYSLGGADLVRRAMAKKKKEKLEHEREAFIYGDEKRGIRGCVNNGISEEAAKTIFGQMMDFASYAFNKSHAAAYAYNSFITAYLKYYYPAEFFAAAMNWSDNNKHPLSELIKEARKFGVEVLPPDINRSEKDFSVENGKVRFALSKIRGVKSNAEMIISERRKNGPYLSFVDFLTRTKVKAVPMKGLILSGTFDAVTDGRSRSGLLVTYGVLKEDDKEKDTETCLKEDAKKYAEKVAVVMAADTIIAAYHNGMTADEVVKVQENAGITVVFKDEVTVGELEGKKKRALSVLSATKKEMDDIERAVPKEEDKMAKLLAEKDMLQAFVSDSPLSAFPSNEELMIAPISDLSDDTEKVFGYISDIRIVKRKADGAEMAFFEINDDNDSVHAVCFADTYRRLKDKLFDGAVNTFLGNILTDNEEATLSVKDVKNPVARNNAVIVDAGDLRLFHIKEQDFKEKYGCGDSKGYILFFYDKITGQIRKAKYKVSDKIFSCGCRVAKM